MPWSVEEPCCLCMRFVFNLPARLTVSILLKIRGAVHSSSSRGAGWFLKFCGAQDRRAPPVRSRHFPPKHPPPPGKKNGPRGPARGKGQRGTAGGTAAWPGGLPRPPHLVPGPPRCPPRHTPYTLHSHILYSILHPHTLYSTPTHSILCTHSLHTLRSYSHTHPLSHALPRPHSRMVSHGVIARCFACACACAATS
jgi:hypothetical protein